MQNICMKINNGKEGKQGTVQQEGGNSQRGKIDLFYKMLLDKN